MELCGWVAASQIGATQPNPPTTAMDPRSPPRPSSRFPEASPAGAALSAVMPRRAFFAVALAVLLSGAAARARAATLSTPSTPSEDDLLVLQVQLDGRLLADDLLARGWRPELFNPSPFGSPPGEKRCPTQQLAAEAHGKLELSTVKKFTVPQVPVIPPVQGTTV